MSDVQQFLASCEADLFKMLAQSGFKLMRRSNVINEDFKAVLTPVHNSLSYEMGGSEIYSSAKLIIRKADFGENQPKENDTVLTPVGEKLTVLSISSLAQEGIVHIELGR